MKAINELYDALQQRRRERDIYRLVCKLPPAVRKDMGLFADHVERRAYRL